MFYVAPRGLKEAKYVCMPDSQIPRGSGNMVTIGSYKILIETSDYENYG
jgi:hypothetical protein